MLNGVKIVNKHMSPQARFSLESSEWEKMNLDTSVVADTLPSNYGRAGIGGGSFYEWIPDSEAWQYQRYDENDFPRSLDGRLMDAYEDLNSGASASASGPASRVAEIAGKEQDFCVIHKGVFLIPTHSKIGQEMGVHFEKLLDEFGKNELIPVCLEKDTPNFYLNREVKSEETHSVIERRRAEFLRKRLNSRETGMAERIACESNHNCESRYSTHW